ncbi:hypothetical protein E2C01_067212 [Portunus trituberculatus]|uniref:Uncharacterized protein n=1 Tax=Portunus trituberculatus TaxID=210409 RepID=A0A5B7HT02_PORTR|nr:hypothetical protein [Portunus trituberculatus]
MIDHEKFLSKNFLDVISVRKLINWNQKLHSPRHKNHLSPRQPWSLSGLWCTHGAQSEVRRVCLKDVISSTRSQECPDSPSWEEHQTHIASLLLCSPTQDRIAAPSPRSDPH